MERSSKVTDSYNGIIRLYVCLFDRTKTVNEKLAIELLANEGFAVNARRGTAHIFSVEALERFLKANNFTHLIRAHEVAQAGFQVGLHCFLNSIRK